MPIEFFGTLSILPAAGAVGTTITISNTGSGFFGAMVVKDTNAGGTSFDNITVVDQQTVTADVPSGYVGPNVYVANPDGENQTIVSGFARAGIKGEKKFHMSMSFDF